MSVKRHRNFLDYWDSRFDENEKILINYPQLANFTFRECNKLWDVLHSDYAAIEEERDKLAQEIMRLVNMNEQLHERHNALREAEKTISACLQDIAFRDGVNAGWNAALLPTDLEACAKKAELLVDPCNRLATLKAARADVDRLLNGAADCEGEG